MSELLCVCGHPDSFHRQGKGVCTSIHCPACMSFRPQEPSADLIKSDGPEKETPQNQEHLLDASLVFLHAFISAKYDVITDPEAHVDAAVNLAKMLYEKLEEKNASYSNK